MRPDDPFSPLRRALLAQSKWAPVLDLPDRQVTQKGFDANGNVVNDPLPSALKVAGGSAKGAAERASGAFDPEPATPAAATGQLTGVWIEFEVLSPNRPPALHRRAVYDAFGPGRRAGAGGRAEPVFDEPAKLARSAALVRQVEFLATGQVLPPDFVSNLLVANMLLNGPLAVKALRPPPGADATRHAMTELGNAKPLATPLLAIASGRAAYRGRDVCVDRVNLFALHHTVAAGDGFVPREYTDIIANGVAVRPAAAAGAARQFFARVTQGILETRIEDVALGDRGKLLPVNTAALFETSEAANVRWVTLRKADDPGLADLRFGDRGRDSLQRIRNDLANGYVVVAPVAPVAPVPARGAVRGGGHVGWWRIDPTDGTCVGMGVGGMGASGVNYAALLHWILRAAIFAFHVAVCSKGGQVNLGCVVCAAVFAAAKMEIAAELVAGAAGVVVCDISGGPNDGGGGGIMGAARAVAAAPTKVAATAPAAACAATARPSAAKSHACGDDDRAPSAWRPQPGPSLFLRARAGGWRYRSYLNRYPVKA